MKKKIKKDVVSLTFDAKMLKGLGKGIKEKLKENQLKIIKREALDTKRHFTKDKWDLDYSFLIHNLLSELLGFNPEYLFLEYLTKNMPLHLKFSDDQYKGLVLSLSKKPKLKRSK